jgi:hypothetical protein
MDKPTFLDYAPSFYSVAVACTLLEGKQREIWTVLQIKEGVPPALHAILVHDAPTRPGGRWRCGSLRPGLSRRDCGALGGGGREQGARDTLKLEDISRIYGLHRAPSISAADQVHWVKANDTSPERASALGHDLEDLTFGITVGLKSATAIRGSLS